MQMSTEEQDQIISEMVKERNALRRERALLEEQITRSANVMSNAASAARLMLEGSDRGRAKECYEYQDAGTFTASLRRYIEIGERLAILKERLDAYC